ncbi:MAG: hypothetical protein EP319_11505 [Deltaproteobacteria bacterium]|nr:MAG: hypothetical protein EP319_11505 [Deltaproteobacteria bacterium]
MRHARFLVCLFALVTTYASKAEDYMLFSVENFWMNQESINTPLSGEIKAKKMLLLFATERIQIEPDPGEIFEAEVFMLDNMINFKKGYISFSSDLGSRNPLAGVNDFNITNADVEFTEKGIGIVGEKLDMTLEGVDFSLENVNLFCDSGGTYSTEIDKLCLENSFLRSNNETGLTTVKIRDTNSDYPLDLELFVRELYIKENSVKGMVQNISGKIRDTHYNMKEANLDCYKYPDLRDLDPEVILNGCLKTSNNTFKNFNLQQKDVDANIGNAHMVIGETTYSLASDKATFKVGSDVTSVSHLEIECEKKPIPKRVDINEHVVLEGCLERGDIRVSRIEVNDEKARSFLKTNSTEAWNYAKSQEDKGIIDLYDFKDIKIISANNKFAFKAKVKFIFRIPVRFRGDTSFNRDKNQLTLNVEAAHIAGIPTKKFVLYLLRKFVSSEDIQVDGNSIIIQL